MRLRHVSIQFEKIEGTHGSQEDVKIRENLQNTWYPDLLKSPPNPRPWEVWEILAQIQMECYRAINSKNVFNTTIPTFSRSKFWFPFISVILSTIFGAEHHFLMVRIYQRRMGPGAWKFWSSCFLPISQRLYLDEYLVLVNKFGHFMHVLVEIMRLRYVSGRFWKFGVTYGPLEGLENQENQQNLW